MKAKATLSGICAKQMVMPSRICARGQRGVSSREGTRGARGGRARLGLQEFGLLRIVPGEPVLVKHVPLQPRLPVVAPYRSRRLLRLRDHQVRVVHA